MSLIDTIKSLFSGGNVQEALKKKFKEETISKVSATVVARLVEEMPESLADAGEEALKAYVSERASDMVKQEVEKQTGGKFQELTDVIVEEATDQVVDAAVQQIKDQLGS